MKDLIQVLLKVQNNILIIARSTKKTKKNYYWKNGKTLVNNM